MENTELARVLMQRSYLQREPPQEPFILASGKASWHYFDCERTTSYAPVLPLLGEAFYRLLEPSVVCVGGPTRGADPIADAVAFYSVLKDRNRPINTFSVRRQRKEHGTTGWIEGSAEPGDRVAFVDDVVTSGSSVIDALKKCSDEGLQVVQIIALVDREEGGLQRIQEFVGPDVPVQSLFRYSILLESYRVHDRGSSSAQHREAASPL